MALTERIEIGQRTILVDGKIEVRTDTVFEKDGVEVARTFHNGLVVPGDDIGAMPPDVARVAAAEHTPARIAAYLAKVAARELAEQAPR